MKKLLVVALALLVGVAAMGYWRGWFDAPGAGTADVRVDPAKFNRDREAFGNTVAEKTKALKGRIAGLWTKTEGLAGEEKTRTKEELADLEKEHDRLENQIKELDSAEEDKFEGIKQDLSKSLDEVEKKIEGWTQKLGKRMHK